MQTPSRRVGLLAITTLLVMAGGLGAATATSPTPFQNSTHPNVHVRATAPAGVNLSRYHPRQYVRSGTPNTTITITSLGPQHVTGQISTPSNASTTLYVRTTVNGYHPHPIYLYYRGRQPTPTTVQDANHSWYRVTLNTTSTPRGFVVRTSRRPAHRGPANVHANVSFNQTHHPRHTHGIPNTSVRAGRRNVHVDRVHAATGNVQYSVNSSQHAGTTIYLKASAVNASLHAPWSAVSARLDGSPIQYGLTTRHGSKWVVVNIPHFSAHNLEFAVTTSSSTSTSGFTILGVHVSLLELVAGGGLLILLVIGVFVWQDSSSQHVHGH